MKDYRPNSLKSKEEQQLPEKNVTPVVSAENVKTKKKSGFQKFFSTFITEDVDDIGDWALHDVIVPAIKRLIDEMVHGLLYSGERRTASNSKYNRIGYTTYTTYNNPSSVNKPPVQEKKSNSVLDYDDIVVNNRGDAEVILSKLCELVEVYGSASVADLYDIVGKTHTFVYNKWGWTDLRNADVTRVRDGYLIKLPRIISLD